MVNVLILAAAAGGLAILLIVRLWAVLQPHHAIPRESLGLLIVAGSGGHTTEILRLVGSLSSAYSPRHYVIAESDEMSAKKIHSLELSQAQNDSTTECPRYHLHRIPRSREVRQSWLSSVFTTLYSMWFSFPLVHQIKPDLDGFTALLWLISTGKADLDWKIPGRAQAQTSVFSSESVCRDS
ncbi:UDP-N-acetylglucosamine transferase subunit ALG14 isoform X3 [Arvicanthis niloticus]|uniref:UDP-N-acetylglucosamine transferase subunit ALG14 isoform X3 n=1 Tax=Arvicanthis niloticus TaxID=61156 RepID=UPI00402B8BFD